MIYRVLDIFIHRDNHPLLRAWVTADNVAAARERVKTAVAWFHGVTAREVEVGNIDEVFDLECAWGGLFERDLTPALECQLLKQISDPTIRMRRWVQDGQLGEWPLYGLDECFVIFLLAPKDRARVQAAYAAARAHEEELRAVVSEYDEHVAVRRDFENEQVAKYLRDY